MKIGLIELLPPVITEINKVFDHVENVTEVNNNQWRAKCPLCLEENRALVIGQYNSGHLSINCVRGCRTTKLTAHFGLDPKKVIGGPLYSKYFDGEMYFLEQDIQKIILRNNQESPSEQIPDDELSEMIEVLRNMVRARYS